jgi:hypothetical protein
MKSKEPSQELTLKEFIEKRKDLLTAASAFAALSLFAKGFIPGRLGEIISLLFVGGFALLWVELLKTFKGEKMDFVLNFFFLNVVLTGSLIIFYWLGKAWLVLKDYFFIVIWYFALVLFGPPLLGSLIAPFGFIIKKVKRRDVPDNFSIITTVLLTLSIMFIVTIGIKILIYKFSPFLDKFFKAWIK